MADQTTATTTGGKERYEFDVTPGHDHKNLTVRWGGREVLRHDIPIETPSFQYAMIKLCVGGAGVFDWQNSRWDIQPGMVFWSVAKRLSTLISSPENPMINYAIFLAGRETTGLMENLFHADVGVATLKDRAAVERIMLEIMTEGRGTAPRREETCALLAQVVMRRIEAEGVTPPEANGTAEQAFHRCRTFITSEYARLTSLSEVARACDVTIPYLCRLFDNFFHCSPYDYLTRLKMSRAENLLLRPNAPVREVAVAVGYKDPRLFARNFKAAFGKSPKQFQQSHAVALES